MTTMTDRAPFAPLGDRPRWETIYALLDGKPPGTVVTYQQMGAALDGFDKDRDRGAIAKASTRLLTDTQRATEAVPNVGYRIVSADEHLRLASRKQTEARRKIKRGRRFLLHFHRDEVSTEVAARVDAMQATMARHEDMLRRLDARTQRTDTLLAFTETRAADTADKVARLEAALRRAGIEVTS